MSTFPAIWKHSKASAPSLGCESALNACGDLALSQLVSVQRCFDVEQFSGASDPGGKRRHIFLHMGVLLGKMARAEERADHGDASFAVVRDEVIPDLLVYAAQLAELFEVDLNDAYTKRLRDVASRNAGMTHKHR